MNSHLETYPSMIPTDGDVRHFTKHAKEEFQEITVTKVEYSLFCGKN